MLWLGKITIYLHATIETKGMKKEDVPALRDRVREIISAPVEESLKLTRTKRETAISTQQPQN
jgi:hypothetical protein